MIDPAFIASGFGVGLIVGLTGVGGGSLMTPILVLIFGINVRSAVGTDLLYAAVTKSVGTAVHGAGGTVDWTITRRLATGSLPAAVLTIAVLYLIGAKTGAVSSLLTTVLGIALIATATCALARRWLERLADTQFMRRVAHDPAAVTIAVGATLGVLVTISSVGAGAIGMTALILLYPRVPTLRLVGSDIAHAVPLTFVAGIGHWFLGSIDGQLLVSLLIGSIPGIILSSHFGSYIPERVLRPILAVVLAVVGFKMLA